jgi:hypothetical protein
MGWLLGRRGLVQDPFPFSVQVLCRHQERMELGLLTSHLSRKERGKGGAARKNKGAYFSGNSLMAPKRKRSLSKERWPSSNDSTQIASDAAEPTNLYRFTRANTNRDEILLKMVHPFCSYPEDPKSYFDKKCKVDVDDAKWLAKHLFVIFTDKSCGGIYFLPPPLIELCNEYILCTLADVVQEILNQSRDFIGAGGFYGARKSNPELDLAISANVSYSSDISAVCTKNRRSIVQIQFLVSREAAGSDVYNSGSMCRGEWELGIQNQHKNSSPRI